MKETIAFPQLVELVTQKANTTERMSELFLQELFAVVTQALADGESVTIKGLGAFKVNNVNNGKDVTFSPDKTIAEAVNAPFSQFEPVELCDEVTDEMLNEIDASLEPKELQEAQEETSQEEETTNVEPGKASAAASQDIPSQNDETIPDTSNSDYAETKLATTEDAEARHDMSAQKQEEPIEPKSKNPRIWLIAAAAAIALIAVWYFYTHRSKERVDKQQIETAQVASGNTDTSKSSESIKPQPIITDTIGNGNVLFTMAKKHYGDQAFWVYIARENQAQFPDYRKIRSGAVLVIPPAEKYGINSDSKQSLKQAGIEAMKLYKEVKATDQNTPNQVTSSTSSAKTVTPSKQSKLKGNPKKNYHNYRSTRKHYRRR